MSSATGSVVDGAGIRHSSRSRRSSAVVADTAGAPAPTLPLAAPPAALTAAGMGGLPAPVLSNNPFASGPPSPVLLAAPGAAGAGLGAGDDLFVLSPASPVPPNPPATPAPSGRPPTGGLGVGPRASEPLMPIRDVGTIVGQVVQGLLGPGGPLASLAAGFGAAGRAAEVRAAAPSPPPASEYLAPASSGAVAGELFAILRSHGSVAQSTPLIVPVALRALLNECGAVDGDGASAGSGKTSTDLSTVTIAAAASFAVTPSSATAMGAPGVSIRDFQREGPLAGVVGAASSVLLAQAATPGIATTPTPPARRALLSLAAGMFSALKQLYSIIHGDGTCVHVGPSAADDAVRIVRHAWPSAVEQPIARAGSAVLATLRLLDNLGPAMAGAASRPLPRALEMDIIGVAAYLDEAFRGSGDGAAAATLFGLGICANVADELRARLFAAALADATSGKSTGIFPSRRADPTGSNIAAADSALGSVYASGILSLFEGAAGHAAIFRDIGTERELRELLPAAPPPVPLGSGGRANGRTPLRGGRDAGAAGDDGGGGAPPLNAEGLATQWQPASPTRLAVVPMDKFGAPTVALIRAFFSSGPPHARLSPALQAAVAADLPPPPPPPKKGEPRSTPLGSFPPWLCVPTGSVAGAAPSTLLQPCLPECLKPGSCPKKSNCSYGHPQGESRTATLALLSLAAEL